MLIVGDVAFGDDSLFCYKNFPTNFFDQKICVNLEGAVSTRESSTLYGTFNLPNWPKNFKNFNGVIAFLGNNHIADVPNGVEDTITKLEEEQIKFFGAGINAQQAAIPLIDGDFVILGFGWHVIGCHPARQSEPGVNPMRLENIEKQTLAALKAYPEKKVLIVFHWNYEFELYPQPAHRSLAKYLIDLGVHAVIGHHSHLASSVELYKGKIIAYGLGNWIFSQNVFFNGALKFPSSSLSQLAIAFNGTSVTVYDVKFDPEVKCLECMRLNDVYSNNLWCRAIYSGFSDQEYRAWFKLHRKKKKFLPIYDSYNEGPINYGKDVINFIRQKGIDISVKMGLKSVKRSA